MDYLKKCRICMGKVADIHIHSVKSKGSCLKDKMSVLFTFEVKEGDGFPDKICKKCSMKVTASFKLKLLAEETHKKLLKLIPVSTDMVKAACVTNCEIHFDIKREEIDDKDDVNCFDSEVNYYHDEDIKNDEIDFKTEVKEGMEDVILEQKYSKETTKKKYYKSEEDSKETKKKKKCKVIESTICDICGKSVINIREHRLLHLPNKKLYKCDQCPKVFQSHSSKRSHIRVVHLGIRYYCTICDKFYCITKTDHNRISHSNKGRDYECNYCNRKFFTKSVLTKHILIHSSERAHLCPVCGKGFHNVTDANYHKRSVHDKEKQHICQYCSKAFFLSTSLKIHTRKHTKDGYKCLKCDKNFVTSYGLNQHMKLHGKKELVCGICQKEFHAQGNLNVHMISHTKEKKHECKYCGVKFGRTDHRNRHEKTAHENKM